MYSLVCFENEELYVCKKHFVSEVNNKISAKYKNRGSYRAKYVVYDDSMETLQSLCNNIRNELPLVCLGDTINSTLHSSYDNIDHEIRSGCDDTFADSTLSVDSMNPIDPDFVMEDSVEISQNSSNCSLNFADVAEQKELDDTAELSNELDVYNKYERVTSNLIVEKGQGTKKYFCCYCHKAITKLARHLETVHKYEDDVKKFSVLPKGCPERKNIIEILRKKGCFIYNTDKNLNKGDIIVARRPSKKRDGSLYKPCPKCRGFFSASSLRRHYSNCRKTVVKGERTVMVESRKILARIHPIANYIMRNEVFPVIREDSISRLIRYDELLIQHGNKLCLKYKAKYNHKMIRAKLRLLGRLLYEMKKINVQVTNFSSIYTPELYDSFVAAVNLLGELSSDGTKYNKPAVPSAIGIEIKKVARLLIANCIRQQNENAKKMAEYFLELFNEDYGGSVNKTVAESQSALKRKKVTTLPIMEDIKVLNSYIKQQRSLIYSNLIENYSSSNWKELASLTLISLLLLNRRRPGELERTLLTDLRNYQTVSEDQNFELYERFTNSERVAARNYGRITIRGKLCREVSVLIPEQEYRCLQLIVKFRKRAGVPMSNPYLFGLPSLLKSQQRYLRACDLLRKYSLQCSAKYPSRLRATLLRKHIATRSAVKGFNESEVSDLANYLGHADKIHRDNYRMPLPALEITRMSAVLEEARGNIQKEADISCSSVNASIFEESGCSSSDILSDSKDTSISWEKCVRRTSWNEDERKTVAKYFSKCLKNGTLPSLSRCSDAISLNKSLRNRTPAQLKAYLHNQIKRKQRLLEQSLEASLRKENVHTIRKSF